MSNENNHIPLTIRPVFRSANLKNSWSLSETKIEFRLDLRYKYKAYKLNLYYEREVTMNLEFNDKSRKGSVLWVGVERDITIDRIKSLTNKIFSK